MADSSSRTKVPFKDKVKRTVAMEPETYDRLVAVADGERRSVSAQIEKFIQDGLDRAQQSANAR